MTDPFVNGPRAARPALLPPTWPPLDPVTGQFDPSGEADPPDGFFVDPDTARRIAGATTIAQGLSPAEAMRDSDRKLSDLTRAQWDLDVRQRTYEEAKAFSFLDPGDGAEPVFAELPPEKVASLDGFSERTGLQVDFPPEYGGYFAAVSDPATNTEIGVVPKGLVLALADNTPGSGMIEAEAGVPDLTRDPDDGEGWFSRFLSSGQMREMVLDLLPIIGNVRSAAEAYESYRDAIEALEREDWGAFVEHGGMGLLNTLGAVGGPFGGPLVRIVKAGMRYLADATPVVRRAVAAHGMKKAANRAGKLYPGVRVEKALGRAFDRLTDEQKKKVRGIFPNVVGKAGERHAIRQAKNAGQPVTQQGPRTATTVDMGGKTATRRYDALIGEVQRNFFVDAFRIFHPNARTVAMEVKAGASHSARQRKIDRAVEADGSFARQVLLLRYPVKAIPEKEFERAARDMFSKHISAGPGGLSPKEVDKIVGKLKRLRRDGGDEITAEIVVGIAARETANFIAGKEESRRQDESRKRGSTMSEIMTGA